VSDTAQLAVMATKVFNDNSTKEEIPTILLLLGKREPKIFKFEEYHLLGYDAV
jgi:hypothetical protein